MESDDVEDGSSEDVDKGDVGDDDDDENDDGDVENDDDDDNGDDDGDDDSDGDDDDEDNDGDGEYEDVGEDDDEKSRSVSVEVSLVSSLVRSVVELGDASRQHSMNAGSQGMPNEKLLKEHP